mmetsp:Transcript_5310/g.8769  ORF Transcript_5310/g.8769 Transcript_5310/m.8769 type:complete len:1539 (-) Transcript_5310:162-4778(-)
MELEHLTLNRVIGLTSLSNSSFISSPDGNILYAAGCVCVLYNPQSNKQMGYFTATRAVSCMNFSNDGKYLAIGERGHLPCVTIWNVKTQKQLRCYTGHEHGISSVRFSPDGKYLVSIGFKHDKQMMLHEWNVDRLVCVEKMENKVNALCFHASGNFFVTCGDRHLKWWYFVHNDPDDKSSVTGLNGRPASILKAQQDSNFIDVACCTKTTGAGDTSAIFCTTSTGMLCLIHEKRLMDKWVQLDSASSYCLTLTQSFVIVGGASGDVFVINPSTLEFIATLPHSVPLSSMKGAPSDDGGHDKLEFAACYGITAIPTTTCVAIMYADRSVFIWDIADVHNPIKYKSFVFHRACIWDLVFIEQTSKNQSMQGSTSDEPDAVSSILSDGNIDNSSLPSGTFATCGADNSVCFWNLDPKMQRKSKWRSSYSRDLLHKFQLDGSVSGSPRTSSDRHFIDGSPPDIELPDRQQGNLIARSLAVHPNGNELACGDKQGRLYVYDLNTMKSMTTHRNIEGPSSSAGDMDSNGFHAHEAEILTLNYSPYFHSSNPSGVDNANDENLVLLASAGRDRLIHVFDATEASSVSNTERYGHLETLDSHSSSVTVVKFSLDGKTLISCGGDKTMVLHSVVDKNVSRKKSIQTPNGTINGITLDIATNKYAVSTGQDKRVNVWNLASGKLLRSYRPSGMGGEMYKCSMDPSGTFVATCSFDKVIRVFDFFSGEIVAQAFGHSDLITGVKFSPDGKYLLSIGGDGCIMQWRLSQAMISEMEDRLLELLLLAEKKAAKVKEKSQIAASGKLPLPIANNNLDTASSDVNNDPSRQPQSKPKPAVSREKKAVRTGGVGLGGIKKGEDRPHTSDNVTMKAPVSSPRRPTTAPHKEVDVQQSKGKLFGGRRPSAPAWAMRKSDASDRSTTSGDSNAPAVKGRWAARNSNQLQILGKPVSRAKGGADMKKLTLEMTVEEATWKPPQPGSPSVLAKTLEDADEVLIEDSTSDSSCSSSDDEAVEGVVDKDADSDEEDRKLNMTNSQLDALEDSALKLETWLERKLREEVALDEDFSASKGNITTEKAESKVIKKPSDRQAKFSSSGKAVLGQSLSSTFFRNIKKESESSEKPKVEHPVQTSASYRGDDLLPPPTSSVASSMTSSSDAMLQKRQETACAVAQMRERLRQMGILEKTGKIIKPVTEDVTPPSSTSPDTSLDPSPEGEDLVSHVAPPLPPPAFVDDMVDGFKEDLGGGDVELNGDDDDDDDTASTVSGGSAVNDNDKNELMELVEKDSEEGVVGNVGESKNRTTVNADEEEEMRQVLRNLEEAREKAMHVYSNLVTKKNAALSVSYASSSSTSNPSETSRRPEDSTRITTTTSTDMLAPNVSDMSPKSRGRAKSWVVQEASSSVLDTLLSDFEESFEVMYKSTNDVLTQSACGSAGGLYRSTKLSKWSQSSDAHLKINPTLPSVSESFENKLHSPSGTSLVEVEGRELLSPNTSQVLPSHDLSTSQQSLLTMSSNVDDTSGANIEAILERYSDRLASMVSAKVLSASTASSQQEK